MELQQGTISKHEVLFHSSAFRFPHALWNRQGGSPNSVDPLSETSGHVAGASSSDTVHLGFSVCLWVMPSVSLCECGKWVPKSHAAGQLSLPSTNLSSFPLCNLAWESTKLPCVRKLTTTSPQFPVFYWPLVFWNIVYHQFNFYWLVKGIAEKSKKYATQ